MKTDDRRPDWAFVGGITFAILSTVAFAAMALYTLVVATP